MRIVYGENVTYKELRKWFFGYHEGTSPNRMVDHIEVNGLFRCSITEGGEAVIRYPVDMDSDICADYCILPLEYQDNLTVYDFINNWWSLDEFQLEDFIFYFAE